MDVSGVVQQSGVCTAQRDEGGTGCRGLEVESLVEKML